MENNVPYQQLGRFIEALQRSGKVRVKSSEYRFYSESVGDADLAVARAHGLADSIIEFYRAVEFVDLQWVSADGSGWSFLDDEDMVAGNLNVPRFSTLVETIAKRTGPAVIDPYGAIEEPQRTVLADYFPIDELHGNGAVCLRTTIGAIPDDLHLVSSTDGVIHPLRVSWSEYLRAGFEHYFIGGWQKAAFLGDADARALTSFYGEQLAR